MTTKRKYVRKAKEAPYTASIKILGRIYTANASDLKTVVSSLPVGKVAKGMSILEITHGERKKSVILPPPQTFRVFSSSGLVKEIAMRQLLTKFAGI